ncbi:uncharacterized protein BJ171DRAFT_218207 [Polychytrium aggregatum]|uniref:uncharacterized protein n=1 Tax=Polychytrium aggregatum TaxID=110093 RepID=UPI0022FED315|nr:uncharacterized protein BJ171DRAFT_218207 [Polychytrium aggregatum]KAI9199209.1 hypothetical protein BJ171DRAFT_218207 [Polychytrium aggregatum]
MASSSTAFDLDQNERPVEDFYKLLDISKNATAEEIKKAYKRAALKYHPDKVGSHPEAVERFQRIRRAYDVLNDPDKRNIYDSYGEQGVTAMETMGGRVPMFHPGMLVVINRIFFLLTICVALLILFPAFLSMRADGKVQWPWVAVFTPLFILDALVLLIAWVNFSREPEDETSEEDFADKESHEEHKRKSKAEKRLSTAITFTYVILLTILQVLIALRLDSVITTSWLVVSVPWFALEAFHGIVAIPALFSKFAMGAYDIDASGDPSPRSLNALEKLKAISDAYVPWALRVIQVVLIDVKANGAAFSWAATFSPVFIYVFLELVSLVLSYQEYRRSRQSATNEQAAEKKAVLGFNVFGFVLLAFTVCYTVGMLITRLNNSDDTTPSSAVILVPVFIIMSTLFCCTCCFLPTILCCWKLSTMAAQEGEEEQVEIINEDRRITNE